MPSGRLLSLVLSVLILGVVYGFQAARRSVGRHVVLQRSQLQMASVPFSIPPTFPSVMNDIASKVSLTTTQITNVFNVSALTALAIAFRKKIASAFTGGNLGMERGWKKRGDGSAAQRTIEVWTFALSFGFKVVRIRTRRRK